ncbi:ATP-binding SpoIIE family protein phosphatase [Streptomyces cavernicola]|uniref:SpoIIE family protein phosphatase n=1 Tax=Streptomyces cavernicola TaxID=3043613 RepID=A0ABT6S7H6_9ACTN|nr:SpoIIE family protein phosphatase [Streptomyces sp. B-S-A6]MDI3404058.1 SpoIIE family protein phosphatase [Streptomyces sp. B-S-A6]
MYERRQHEGRLTPPLPHAPFDTAAVAVTDRDGRVTYWSGAAQALLGYAPGEVLGRPVADLVAADGTLRHRDGRPVDAQLRLCPLLDAEQEAGFLLTIVAGTGTGPSEDGSLTRWIFEQQPLALAIADRSGRWLRENESMHQVTGKSEAEVRGLLQAEFLHGHPVFGEMDRRTVRVAESGQAEFTEPFVKLPGEAKAHAWAVDIFPLKDAAGHVHAVAFAASDTSQQYSSRERLALVSEARTRIGGSLDIVGTAQELTEVAVPRFADLVNVDLLDPVFQGELPSAVLPGPVTLRRAAQRSGFPLPENLPRPGETHRHPASSPVARCLADGRAVVYDVNAPEVARWFADEPAHAALAEAIGVHSLIAVPIRARGTTLGTVLFIRCDASRDPFGPDDLAVTEDLIARAAICLDNARRFTRERGISLALQHSLLPRGPTLHPAVETAVRYLPAGAGTEAGGDWFDVIPLPGARVGLVVGDVVGHGITASATMGRLRTAVRTLADIDLPPDELLTHLDDMLSHADDTVSESEQRAPTTAGIPGEIGATCLYAVYDPVSGTCSMARAGHPAPVLVHPDGTGSVVDLPAGPPLGLGSLPFETAELTVPEGSLLALFTDGLLDSRADDIDEALSDLRRALTQPVASLEALADAVLALCPEPRADDVALLIARTRILDRDHVVSWELPNDTAVVAEARKRACDSLAAWGLEEEAFVTELVVSELVTNAIRYGGSPIRLRLIHDRCLICEVSDGSSTSPRLRRARVFDEGGRGLLLVAQLTQRWGTRYTRTGKTIWAEQSLSTG